MHKKSDTELLVIGVFFDKQEGKAGNLGFLENEHFKEAKNGAEWDQLKVKNFLNELTGTMYHYSGSLTTPPCSEIVEWFIFEEPIYIPPRILQRMTEQFGETGTARPVQALNGRKVFKGQSYLASFNLGLLALATLMF